MARKSTHASRMANANSPCPLVPVFARVEDNKLVVEIDGDYETHGLEDLGAVRLVLARRGYELFYA